MLIALGAATLGACSDPLPGFANPPAYDAGAEQDASDEDAG